MLSLGVHEDTRNSVPRFFDPKSERQMVVQLSGLQKSFGHAPS
jgi:hypothetical protein